MAATPKHRRSSSKKRSTRASNRYDVALTKSRTIKRKGGKHLSSKNSLGVLVPSHRVTSENPEYKGIKVIKTKNK